jgi:DNA-binding NarL/FixJ family response regulator
VLIVEHQPIFAESLAQVLAQKGISALGAATNGSNGIAHTGRVRPKVVLVTSVMPDTDGLVVNAPSKRLDPAIMVVMLTDSTADQVLRAAIDAGCSGFLTNERVMLGEADAQ